MMSYLQEVGAELRQVRMDRGWSLHDVERISLGRWKAGVLGSYERGDRTISASRLVELAGFYEVSPDRLLPGEPAPSGNIRSGGVVLDLASLDRLPESWEPVRRYLMSIQSQRGDLNRRVLSIRGEDLRVLSVLHGGSPDGLVRDLREAGVVIER